MTLRSATETIATIDITRIAVITLFTRLHSPIATRGQFDHENLLLTKSIAAIAAAHIPVITLFSKIHHAIPTGLLHKNSDIGFHGTDRRAPITKRYIAIVTVFADFDHSIATPYSGDETFAAASIEILTIAIITLFTRIKDAITA